VTLSGHSSLEASWILIVADRVLVGGLGMPAHVRGVRVYLGVDVGEPEPNGVLSDVLGRCGVVGKAGEEIGRSEVFVIRPEPVDGVVSSRRQTELDVFVTASVLLRLVEMDLVAKASL
jgi:hypothetical protein